MSLRIKQSLDEQLKDLPVFVEEVEEEVKVKKKKVRRKIKIKKAYSNLISNEHIIQSFLERNYYGFREQLYHQGLEESERVRRSI